MLRLQVHRLGWISATEDVCGAFQQFRFVEPLLANKPGQKRYLTLNGD